MDSVSKAKNRIHKYPVLFIECRNEGKLYAACIASKQDIQFNACVNEFRNFKNCLMKSAIKLGTKL
ncbi:hypothetical protein PGB90_008532 [Kerria lacca]